MSKRRPAPADSDPRVHPRAEPAGQLTEILKEIDAAAALLADLSAKPGNERHALPRAEVRLHALKLCDLLEVKSREEWFSDPAKAIELAELAVEISNRLDNAHYGRALVEHARTLAWLHLGNAYQAAADLRRAKQAHDQAKEHHWEGAKTV